DCSHMDEHGIAAALLPLVTAFCRVCFSLHNTTSHVRLGSSSGISVQTCDFTTKQQSHRLSPPAVLHRMKSQSCCDVIQKGT
ncbi:myotubularin-related protein 5 isoform X1, partial [Tachysurus ichikawai]